MAWYDDLFSNIGSFFGQIGENISNYNDPSNYANWAHLYGLTDYIHNGAASGMGDRPVVDSRKQNAFESALIALYQQGKISAIDLSGYLNYLVYRDYDSAFEKWLDNQIALENTNSARNWEQQMAETSLIRSADQLKQLGLSPSSVLQAGGSNVNPVAAPDNVKTNIAQQRYEQRMGMTKSLISMVTGMASAGIGGAALGIARNTLAKQAMQTAHNATNALKGMETQFDNHREFVFGKLADLELANKFKY